MVPVNIHTQPEEGHWKFQGEGGGGTKPKYLKESMRQNWNFQRGGGGGFKPKIPSVGGVWIFSGTTHCKLFMNKKTI